MAVLKTRAGAFRQLRAIAYLAMIVLVHSTTALAATVTAATCGSTDVAKALDSASDGDTVAIPAGQCRWTANVSTSKRADDSRGRDWPDRSHRWREQGNLPQHSTDVYLECSGHRA